MPCNYNHGKGQACHHQLDTTPKAVLNHAFALILVQLLHPSSYVISIRGRYLSDRTNATHDTAYNTSRHQSKTHRCDDREHVGTGLRAVLVSAACLSVDIREELDPCDSKYTKLRSEP